MKKYSHTFAHTITSLYGSAGAQWLEQLPIVVEQCAQKWNLTDLIPYQNLTYNCVLSGTQGARLIVLKLRCNSTELQKEVMALKAFNGFGSAQIIAYDFVLGALLLDQLIPGETLESLFAHDDVRATRIAADLIQKLHAASIPKSDMFPSLEQLLPEFHNEPQVLAPFIAKARILRTKLLATQSPQVLLHGDFHAGNILSSGNTWLTIDPEGVIGDPVYDLAVYIRNPLKRLLQEPNPHEIIYKRITDFSNLLGYDAQGIYDWTYLQTATSAYWSTEDGLDITKHVAFLRLLQQIRV